MIKKIIPALSLLLITVATFANDIYELKFSSENNCSMTKNSENVPLFDKRFKSKKPISPYSCDAIQKEQYNDCNILTKTNISALYFGYGAYGSTNLIIAFKNSNPSKDSSIKITCTKKLKIN